MSRRLRVGIDAHMVGGQETGNETYIRGLVEGFGNVNEDLDLLVFNVGSPWTQPGPHVKFQSLLTGNPLVRLGIEMPIRSLGQHLDVVHVTYAAPLWSAAPVVVTIHDICYVTNPEWFSSRDLRILSTMVPRSIRKATHIITDSHDARRQIIDVYSVPESKISAITIGPGPGAQAISIDAARTEVARLGLRPERPYLLTVGNLQPRKNLIRLVKAFTQLVGQYGHDIDLVVVGPKRYRAEEIIKAAGPVAERVHFTGYITDLQLAACYRCSYAFALPSLYEGFGLPVIEAMAHGIPVACSNAGALPEVCGEAAAMFDPLSVEEMTSALDRILRDSELREVCRRSGLVRAAEFSWERTARLTMKVYESARR